MASWLLGLRSYLFGEEDDANADEGHGDDNNNGVVNAAAAADAVAEEVAAEEDEEEEEEDEEEWEPAEEDLLEEEEEDDEQPDLPPGNPQPFLPALGPAHAAFINREAARTGFQDYHKPDYFPLRVRFKRFLF